jgi:hypothetical protein
MGDRGSASNSGRINTINLYTAVVINFRFDKVGMSEPITAQS